MTKLSEMFVGKHFCHFPLPTYHMHLIKLLLQKIKLILCLKTPNPDEKLDKKEALKVIPHKCQLNGPVLDHIQEKNMDLSSSSHHPN